MPLFLSLSLFLCVFRWTIAHKMNVLQTRWSTEKKKELNLTIKKCECVCVIMCGGQSMVMLFSVCCLAAAYEDDEKQVERGNVKWDNNSRRSYFFFHRIHTDFSFHWIVQREKRFKLLDLITSWKKIHTQINMKCIKIMCYNSFRFW